MTVLRPAIPHRATGQYGLWMGQALAAEGDPSVVELREEIAADVCIVGGGFTGLWTAIRTLELEPSARVVVLEADICGSGASGRNGGMALSWWPKLETLIERVGEEEGLRLADLSEQAIGDLEAFCAAEGVDAELRRGGWLWTATSRAQLGAWEGAAEAAERRGRRPFERVSAQELRERTGSPAHLGGVFEASAATVQPARLARGLRRVAIERGARVLERSPMLELDRESGRVRTPHGAVTAGSIVLATNAWLAGVPELRRAVVPLSSDVIATAPMAEQISRSGWTGGESLSNSRLMVHYYRTTDDGRIVFGRGGGGLGVLGRFGDRFDYARRRAASIERDLALLVPAARDVPVAAAWGGAVDRSSDGLPFFGRLRGRAPIHYGAGFSGNGVAPSLIAGRVLGSLALGRDDEWSGCGLAGGIPGRFPPEPVRFLGGVVVREAVRRKELREDRGASVDGMTLRIAALAPSGFFKVSKGEHPEEARQGEPAGSPGGPVGDGGA